MIKNSTVILDSNTTLPDGLIKSYVFGNYEYGMDDLFSTSVKVKLFIDKIKSKYDLTESSFHLSNNRVLTLIEDKAKTFFLTVYKFKEKEVDLAFFSKELPILEEMIKLFQSFKEDEEENFVIFQSMYATPQGLQVDNSHLNLEAYDKETKNYYPYIDTDELFKQFITSKNNILILSGEKGLGKTKMINLYIKYLLNNIELINSKPDLLQEGNAVRVLYIKNEDLLARDDLWVKLNTEQYDVVVLDDLDYFLTSRKNADMTELGQNQSKFISQLLSFSDGVINNNTKFVITTNNVSDIDDALLRPGRCFDILRMRALHKKEALQIAKDEFGLKISNNLIDLINKHDIITAAQLGDFIDKEYQVLKKQKQKDYLLEEDISVLNSLDKHKKTIRIGGR